MIIQLFDLSKLNQSDIDMLQKLDSLYEKDYTEVKQFFDNLPYIVASGEDYLQWKSNELTESGLDTAEKMGETFVGLSLQAKIYFYNLRNTVIKTVQTRTSEYLTTSYLESIYDKLIDYVDVSKYTFVYTIQSFINEYYEMVIQQQGQTFVNAIFGLIDATSNYLNNASRISNTSFTREFVGNKVDSNDSYTFYVDTPTDINLNFNNIIGNNASVYLYDSFNQQINFSNITDGLNFSQSNLSNGTYYIQVKPTSNYNDEATYYEFSTSITPIAIPEPVIDTTITTEEPIESILGSSKKNPFIINNLNSKNYFKSEEVLSDQPVDYYKFKLTKSGTFTFKLTNLDENVDLFLINKSTNKVIKSSKKSGNADEVLSNISLKSGTYFVKVANIDNSNSFYDLAISRKKTSTPASFPENQSVNLSYQQFNFNATNKSSYTSKDFDLVGDYSKFNSMQLA